MEKILKQTKKLHTFLHIKKSWKTTIYNGYHDFYVLQLSKTGFYYQWNKITSFSPI
jgi:phage anti-repressor protein